MSSQSPGDERPEGGDVPAPDGAMAQVQVEVGLYGTVTVTVCTVR